MTIAHRFGVLLSCVAALASPAVSQSALPPDLVFFVNPFVYESCAAFDLAGTAAGDVVTARVGFDNRADSEVLIRWEARHGDALSRNVFQRVATPYAVTAVTRRAGRTDTLYVVGWFGELEQLVVERWRIGPVVLEDEPLPDGRLRTGMAEPSIERTCLYRSLGSGADPMVRGAACHPFVDTLFLLTHEPERRILSVGVGDASSEDPQANALAERWTAADHPFLPNVNSLKAEYSETGGLVLVAQPRLYWNNRFSEPYYMALQYPEAHPPVPEPELLAFADPDLDGADFELGLFTDSQFLRMFKGTWVSDFAAP